MSEELRAALAKCIQQFQVIERALDEGGDIYTEAAIGINAARASLATPDRADLPEHGRGAMSARPPNYYGVVRDGPLRDAVGAVVDRWYRAGLLRFNTHDDGSDDLLLRDEICSSVMDALRSPRNALGKLALPKGLMEKAVEAAWDGATSPVGDPMEGIEMHNLADLADGICDFIAYGPLSTPETSDATPEPSSEGRRRDRADQPEQTNSADYNRGWADGNAAALDACNPVIEALQARLATPDRADTPKGDNDALGHPTTTGAAPTGDAPMERMGTGHHGEAGEVATPDRADRDGEKG